MTNVFHRFLVVAVALAAAGAWCAEPVRILVSFHPVLVTTLNIVRGVQGVTVVSVAKENVGCLHDYQLCPADLVALSKASAFVINGADMEPFVAEATNRVPNLPVIDSSAGVVLITNEYGLNPHVWLSVSNVILQTMNIANGLARLDPAHAAAYRTNALQYAARLETLRGKMALQARTFSRRAIVTQHDAFPYLARDLGLTIAGVIQREPGEDLSAGRVRSLAQAMRAGKVAAVFAEPQYDRRGADTVAREAGVKVLVLDSCVSGPADPDAYITAMERNLSVLASALSPP